jgi:hypothetical protein
VYGIIYLFIQNIFYLFNFNLFCREEKERKRREKEERDREKAARKEEEIRRKAQEKEEKERREREQQLEQERREREQELDLFPSLAVEVHDDTGLDDVEDDFHSYYNNKYDDEDDDFEEEEEEEMDEEEEEEEEDEGYPYPIGPMPQEIYNDLRSLDEMVRNKQGHFLGFFLDICFNTASSAAPQITLCRRMLGSTSALAVRRSNHWLDLIH